VFVGLLFMVVVICFLFAMVIIHHIVELVAIMDMIGQPGWGICAIGQLDQYFILTTAH